MRDGLDARSRGVDVRRVGVVEDGEGGGEHALGRDVDVAAPEGRGGREEERLGEDPFLVLRGEVGEEEGHGQVSESVMGNGGFKVFVAFC